MRRRFDPEQYRILVGLWNLQGGRCAYCGCAMPHPDNPSSSKPQTNATIDHMTPRSRGGLDSLENRIGACDGCNQAKGNLDAATFLRVRLNPVMLHQAQYNAGIEGLERRREREAEAHARR